MNTFSFVFLSALALATLVRLWLGWRHIRHIRMHRAAVPAEFADQISLDAHQRAADYTCVKTRLSLFSVVMEALLLLWLTFGGGLQAMQDLTAQLPGGILEGLALIALVMLVMTVFEMPFSIYRTFRVEEQFGFNKMTPRMFALDAIKSLAVAALLGLPLAACVLWLMATMGAWWWLYAWLVWVAFNLVMLAVYPTWIAPLFNKFTPLQDAALKQRVERLLDRCGFKVRGLMVMDGSKRSSHGNAYFTGFGKSKRIVFFDTLLSRLEPPEVEAVLAHELGHFKLRHVVKRMIWIFSVSLGILWLLGYLMQKDWFFHGLNIASPSTAMALILFFMVLPNFTFLLQPLLSLYSRKHEFEADQYACQNANARDLATALAKLYKDNASTLTPDPLHSAFYDSHPPAPIRIAHLRQAVAAS